MRKNSQDTVGVSHISDSRVMLVAIVIVFAVIFLMFSLFKPFGIDVLPGATKWLTILFISAWSAVSSLLPRFIFPESWFASDNWNIGRKIINILLVLFIITFGIWLFFKLFLSGEEYGPVLKDFPSLMANVFLVGIIPVSILAVLSDNLALRKNLLEAERINRVLSSKGDLPSFEEHPVSIKDGSKNDIMVETAEFLFARADGNYVHLYLSDGGGERTEMIRSTLKQVEESFSGIDSVRRCHRAYLLNLDKVIHLTGNSQGCKAILSGCAEEVPIARSYYPEISALLTNKR